MAVRYARRRCQHMHKSTPGGALACANPGGRGVCRAVVTTHRCEVPAYLPRRGELPLVGHEAVLFSGQPDSAGLRVVTTSTLAAHVAPLKQCHTTPFPVHDECTGDRNSSRDRSSVPTPAAQRKRLHFASVAGQRIGRPADDAGNCAGSFRGLSRLLNGKAGISPAMALALAQIGLY